MRTIEVLRPKSPRNLAWTAGLSLLALLAYLAGGWGRTFSPKAGVGLVFGVLAGLSFVFEMGYPARRPRAFPLRDARAWLQAHVYLGALAFLGVLLHTGFGLPHGAFGWALWLLSLWTTLTGLLGVALQKWVPAALAEGLRVEALYERMPGIVAELREQADALAAGAGETLEAFYRRELRPALLGLRPSLGYLMNVRAGEERALEPFRRMGPFVQGEERQLLEDLTAIMTEKRELDAQYTLQGLLRAWLVLHVPPAGLMMGLLLVHVVTWVWY